MAKKDLLISLVKESVQKCYDEPCSLTQRQGMEQACVARIHFYMQLALNNDPIFLSFHDKNLDCEYNKNGTDLKRTIHSPNGTRPDIILHKRGNNNNNTLIIEFKLEENNGDENDFQKLKDFTDTNQQYKYFLGVFVKLMHNGPQYTYFQKGRKINIT